MAGAMVEPASATINVRRLLETTARVVLFSAVVWNIYSTRFLPYKNQPFDDADTEAAVRAINAGHPFELMDVGTDGNPPHFRRMSDAPIDRGMQLVLAVGAAAGR